MYNKTLTVEWKNKAATTTNNKEVDFSSAGLRRSGENYSPATTNNTPGNQIRQCTETT